MESWEEKECRRWATAIGEWRWCFGACAAIGATTGVAVDIAGPGVSSKSNKTKSILRTIAYNTAPTTPLIMMMGRIRSSKRRLCDNNMF